MVMNSDAMAAKELLSQLKQISATLRSATHFTKKVSLQSWTLLKGFTSPENMSLARRDAIALNEECEKLLDDMRQLLKQSRELSNRLQLSAPPPRFPVTKSR